MRFILKRVLAAIPTLVGVIIVTFVLTRMLPGDPAAYFAGPAATAQSIEDTRHRLGLARRERWRTKRMAGAPEYRRPVAGPHALAGERCPENGPGLARMPQGEERAPGPAPGKAGLAFREAQDVEGRVRREPHSSSSPKVATEKAGW